MSTLGISAGFVAVLLLLITASVAFLWRPLGRSLEELCGARQRGQFWSVMSSACLVLGGSLSSLVGLGFVTPHEPGATVFWIGVATLRLTLAGLLAGLLVIGAIVLFFTARLASGVLAPPGR